MLDAAVIVPCMHQVRSSAALAALLLPEAFRWLQTFDLSQVPFSHILQHHTFLLTLPACSPKFKRTMITALKKLASPQK